MDSRARLLARAQSLLGDIGADALLLLQLQKGDNRTARVIASYPEDVLAAGSPWMSADPVPPDITVITSPTALAAAVPGLVRLALSGPTVRAVVGRTAIRDLAIAVLWTRAGAPVDADAAIRYALDDDLALLALTESYRQQADGAGRVSDAVLSGLDQAVVLIDETHSTNRLNPAAARWLGLAAGSVPTDQLARALRVAQTAAINADEVHLRLTQLERNPLARITDWVWQFAGQPSHLRVSTWPVDLPTLRGRVWLFDDVSAIHQAIDRAGRSEQQYRLLAENASDVVYSAGRDRRVTWVAPAITRTLGWEPGEIVGTIMADLVHPDDRAATDEARDRLYAGVEVPNPRGGYLVRMRCRDGSYRWLSNSITMLRDEEGKPAGIVGGLTLVEELVAARDRAEQDEQLLRVTADALLDPQVLLRPRRHGDGTIVDFEYLDANRAATEYLGLDRENLMGTSVLTTLPGLAESGLLAMYVHVITAHEPVSLDAFRYWNEILGVEAYYDIRAVHVSGDLLSLTWRDVTEVHRARQQIAASEERYRLLAENSTDVVVHLRGGVVEWVSPSVESVMGWPPSELVGTRAADVTHPDDGAAVARMSERSTEARVMRLRLRTREGGHHWCEMHYSPYINADGVKDGVIASFRIVDSEVAAERALHRRATYDDLTGALKRDPALQQLNSLAHEQRDRGPATGVLFIDVDSFKSVNDRWGHAAGDEILRVLADRIRVTIRGDDTLARMGGDEFLVTLSGVRDLAGILTVAEKLRVSAAEPLPFGGDWISATVSIGATLAVPGEAADALIARADQGMYEAKAKGRNQVIAIGAPTS